MKRVSKTSFEFCVRDWLADGQLSRCSAATRGVYIDMLANMWTAEDRGKLIDLTTDEIARLCRCTPMDAMIAVDELAKTNTCNIDRSNGRITVVNRRMVRDEQARISAAERQKRFRERKSNATDSGRLPDELWDAIAAIFYPSGVAKSQATRVGKVVRDLKELHATPEQVRERYAAARRAWTDVAVFGPEALVKNWDGLGGRLPAGGTAKSEKTLALEAMWAREAAERKADEARVLAERAKKLPSP